jgi:hypothetical protein
MKKEAAVDPQTGYFFAFFPIQFGDFGGSTENKII